MHAVRIPVLPVCFRRCTGDSLEQAAEIMRLWKDVNEG